MGNDDAAAVFADEGAAKTAAKRAFEAWVAGLPRAPKRSIDLVRSVDIQVRYVGCLVTELEGRRVVDCFEPAPGREPSRSPPYVRQQIDPWSPPDDLPRASRFTARCWNCDATGRVECAACRGAARRSCSDCDGAGKYYGVAANGARRMLNCKTCRGKGHVACADCARGKVECGTCHHAKKLACWLEVRSELRQDLQIIPADRGVAALRWNQLGARVSQDQFAHDARIVEVVTQPRALAVADLSAAIPAEWRIEHGQSLKARIEPSERVRSQTFAFLAVPTTRVTYSILGEHHAVDLEGLRMLAPPATGAAAEPFARRARRLGGWAVLLAALPVLATALYLARGGYFTTGRAGGLVAGIVGLTAAAAAAAYAALWNASLRRRRARTWAIAAIAPVAVAAALAAVAEPRVGRADDLVAAGRLDAASSELRALGLHPDDAAWAPLHLQRSLAASTCTDATTLLRDIRLDLPQRAQAQAHADELAFAEAQAAIRIRNADLASTALACSSDPARRTAVGRAVYVQLAELQCGRCLDSKDWACALARSASTANPAARRAEILAAIRAEADTRATAATHEQRLEQRVENEQAALGLWQAYLLDPPNSAIDAGPVRELRASLARDQPALAAQRRIEQARAEAEARRQADAAERERKQAELAAERERKRAELAAERERRRNEAEQERASHPSGGLLCNDGTLSPTCTCGGSHRGCCSWHGGVAGCQ